MVARPEDLGEVGDVHPIPSFAAALTSIASRWAH